jgi:hypothetical protein
MKRWKILEALPGNKSQMKKVIDNDMGVTIRIDMKPVKRVPDNAGSNPYFWRMGSHRASNRSLNPWLVNAGRDRVTTCMRMSVRIENESRDGMRSK